MKPGQRVPAPARKIGNRYQLIDGLGRLVGLKANGRKTMLLEIREQTEASAAGEAIAANLQRRERTYRQQCRMAADFVKLCPDLSQTEAAAMMNTSQPELARKLGALKLPANLLDLVDGRNVTAGHIEYLLPLADWPQYLDDLAWAWAYDPPPPVKAWRAQLAADIANQWFHIDREEYTARGHHKPDWTDETLEKLAPREVTIARRTFRLTTNRKIEEFRKAATKRAQEQGRTKDKADREARKQRDTKKAANIDKQLAGNLPAAKREKLQQEKKRLDATRSAAKAETERHRRRRKFNHAILGERWLFANFLQGFDFKADGTEDDFRRICQTVVLWGERFSRHGWRDETSRTYTGATFETMALRATTHAAKATRKALPSAKPAKLHALLTTDTTATALWQHLALAYLVEDPTKTINGGTPATPRIPGREFAALIGPKTKTESTRAEAIPEYDRAAWFSELLYGPHFRPWLEQHTVDELTKLGPAMGLDITESTKAGLVDQIDEAAHGVAVLEKYPRAFLTLRAPA